MMFQWQTPPPWRGREMVHGCKSLLVGAFCGSLVTNLKKRVAYKHKTFSGLKIL